MKKYSKRRWLIAGLVSGTLIVTTALLILILRFDGLSLLDYAMLVLFVISSLWPVIGAWNAVIGFILRCCYGDHAATALWPVLANRLSDRKKIIGRTAIVMPVYDENPIEVFANLTAIAQSLARFDVESEKFSLYLLSDSQDPDIIAEEERCLTSWNLNPPGGFVLGYRHRINNAGFKAGNIREFCVRARTDYDYLLVLDADSVMEARLIARLARLFDADPKLGIVQTLVVGSPAETLFARLFQFGMRQGMRTYTLGSMWWQGSDGPYWGHNAMLRIVPFIDHCGLPLLKGKPPLGGVMLSHDQVEAILMCRAGFTVHVLAEEGESFEKNPPTLIDFIRRDLRWCQGNLQYLRLIAQPGWSLMARIQLGLAILMYLGSVAWMGFVGLGLFSLFAHPSRLQEDNWLGWERIAPPPTLGLGVGLFAAVLVIALMPKILGVLDLLRQAESRRRYGGCRLLLMGAGSELVFSALLTPILAIAQTGFIIGLFCGRGLQWKPQFRTSYGLSIGLVVRRLWPQTFIGLVVCVFLTIRAPWLLPWASPLLLGLMGAVPLACLSASPRLSAWCCKIGLYHSPEETAEYRPLILQPKIEATETRPTINSKGPNIPIVV